MSKLPLLLSELPFELRTNFKFYVFHQCGRLDSAGNQRLLIDLTGIEIEGSSPSRVRNFYNLLYISALPAFSKNASKLNSKGMVIYK